MRCLLANTFPTPLITCPRGHPHASDSGAEYEEDPNDNDASEELAPGSLMIGLIRGKTNRVPPGGALYKNTWA